MKTYSNEELLQKAAAYCSLAEHCISEVRTKLTAWGSTSETTQKIIAHLQNEDFINEKRYCRAFVNDKIRYAKWGKIKIAYMLRGKQVEESCIAEALQNIDEDEYLLLLQHLLQAKNRELKCEANKRYAKLCQFAQSRGFENVLISKMVKSVVSL